MKGIKGMLTDVIQPKSWGETPSQVTQGLQGLGFTQQNVRSVVYVQTSVITKAASAAIAFANAFNTVSGVVLGGAQNKAEMQKALEFTIAQQALNQVGPAGEVVAQLYKVTTTGQDIQQAVKVIKKAKDATMSGPLLAATALSYVLDAEMAYINTNMAGGFKDLWTFNPTYPKLDLYIAFVDASPGIHGMANTKGTVYFYRRESDNRYVIYYTDLISSKLVKR